MAALTQDRVTPMKSQGRPIAVPVAADAVIFKGATVCTNAAGYLVPADAAANLTVMGIADQSVDNTGGANGAVSCLIQKGVAGLRGGSTPPTQADVGKQVEVENDGDIQPLGTGVNNIPAGVLDSIGSDGLFYVFLLNS